MITLTQDQVNILTQMANGKSYFATFPSIEADGHMSNKIDQLFAESLQLLEYGICMNVTSLPRFKSVVDKYKKKDGRDLYVLALCMPYGTMFKRTSGDKWTN